MRLHACLLAHRAGRPVLGLAYDPKVSAHFAEVGRARFALPLDAAVDDYGNALEALSSPGAALDASTKHTIETLERESRHAIDTLVRRLPNTPSPRRHLRIADTGGQKSTKPSTSAPVATIAQETSSAAGQEPTAGREAFLDPDVVVGGDFVRVADEREIGEADLTLTETPRWLSITGVAGAQYRFIFRTRVMPGEEPSAAVVLFEVPGDSRETRTEYGVLNRALGRHRFLPHGLQGGIVKLRITIPASGTMRVGFCAWKNQHPVTLSSRFSIVSE
jgi:hypothetical protein